MQSIQFASAARATFVPAVLKPRQAAPQFSANLPKKDSPEQSESSGLLQAFRKRWILPMAFVAALAPLAGCGPSPNDVAVEYNNIIATQGADAGFEYLRAKIQDNEQSSSVKTWAIIQATMLPGHTNEKVFWTVQALRLSNPDNGNEVDSAKKAATLLVQDQALNPEMRELLQKLLDNYPEITPRKGYGRGSTPAYRQPFSEQYRKAEQDLLLKISPVQSNPATPR